MTRLSTLSNVLVTGLLAVLGPRATAAQHYFDGIGKQTWATDDARGCFAWFQRYLNGSQPEPNNCPNNECACGQTGRVRIENVTNHPVNMYNVTAVDAFGIHAVNCSKHPHGDCALRDFEAAVGTAFQGLSSGYDALMDYNLGLWTDSLGELVDRFDADGVAYHLMQWTTRNGSAPGDVRVYSALANPCGSVLIEFISTQPGTRDTKLFTLTDERMDFSGIWNHPPAASAENPYGLAPLKISRAATNLTAVLEWYQMFFGADGRAGAVAVLANKTFPDGAKLMTLKLPDTPTTVTSVHMQFWDRTGTARSRAQRVVDDEAGEYDCSTWTASKWEAFLLQSLRKDIQNTTCGFSKWLDFHYSFDCLADTCRLSDFAERMDASGWKYRWTVAQNFLHTHINWWQIYTYDPTGYGIELHFGLGIDPPDAPDTSLFAPSCFSSYENGTCPGEIPGSCS